MRPRSSMAKRLQSLITAISVMTICGASTVFAVPPNTVFLPDFSKELLTPVSQSAAAWQSVIPNALDAYYTYIPYTTADATAAGFPAALNCGAAAPTGSDCYTITGKEFTQELSLNFLG